MTDETQDQTISPESVDDFSTVQARAIKQQMDQGLNADFLLQELGAGAADYVKRAAERARARTKDQMQASLRRSYDMELTRMGGRKASLDAKSMLRQKFRRLGLDI